MNETLATRRVLLVIPPADDRSCHTVRFSNDSLSLCGMLLPTDDPAHDGEYWDGVCTGCGKPACPTCEIMARE